MVVKRVFTNISENNIYKNYVNGEWILSNSNRVIDIHSPLDDTLVGRISAMNHEEVDNAIRTAKAAQKQWRDVPISEKAKILYKAAELIEEGIDIISEIMIREIAKDKKSAVSEILRTADFIRFTVDVARNIIGESMQGDSFPGYNKDKLAIIKREPIGVILAISPFNYPINLSASKIVPGLMAGNAIVLKPSTQGCITTLHLIKILELAGIPSGVLNTITGKGSEIGDYAVSHQDINMINFTGSTEVGKQISEVAKLVPLLMELGGKDAAIVLKDAELEHAAEQIVEGAYSYSGQRCTAIKRVIVVNEVADNLVKILKEKVENLKVGNPLIEDVNIVPVIDDRAADYIEELIKDSLEKGATLISGGNREGRVIYPTLIDNVNADMKIAWVEPFGPILPIIRVQNKEEAIQITNDSKYGLQAAVFTMDINEAFYVADISGYFH